MSVELPKEFKNGQVIKFGRYFKNNNNKKEPLEWRVLETDGKTALLITENAIDCKQYHHKETIVSWHDCDLRKWCNRDFIRDTFSETEKKLIVTTINQNNYGLQTDDLIFCISTDEAIKYFGDNKNRICKATSYALQNRAYDGGNGCAYWWLRSNNHPNYYASYTANYVDSHGFVSKNGCSVSLDNFAVRLACRINIES